MSFMNSKCKVHLVRDRDESIDDYWLFVKNPLRVIRIRDRNELINMYMHQRKAFDVVGEPPITYTIHGEEHTFDFWTAADIHHTIESWFWEYVDTAESRAV